jgi:ABC-type uncharacterized transport system YnjBCD ATPase subunit
MPRIIYSRTRFPLLLANVSLEVADREVVTMVAPCYCGKSTLL